MERDHFPLGRSGEMPWQGVESVLGLKEWAGLERWRREQRGGDSSRSYMGTFVFA